MRIAVVGAGRTVNGTGPFLGTFCAEAGATIAAVLTAHPETAAAAANTLRTGAGAGPVPHHDPDAFFATPELDALVIASPAVTHAPYLRRAADLGLHALCEKPLVWGAADPAAEALEITRRFEVAGLWLRVNAQWPLTLPAFRTLHPEAPAVPTRFEMMMSPPSTGLGMLVESLSHPLSLLGTLLPGEDAQGRDIRVQDIRVERPGTDWRLTFDYVVGRQRIAACLQARSCARQPRPAWYALDDYRADRRVELDPFRLSLEADGRTVPLPDPARLLVRSFLEDIASDRTPVLDPAAVPGVDLFAQILDVARPLAGTS
jgi:hypothetical protein